MGDRLEHTGPAVDKDQYDATAASENLNTRAIYETGRRIEASLDEHRVEALHRLPLDDIKMLIGAAHALGEFIARSTGNADAAVEQGIAILDLSQLPTAE